jgi:hypothetical protein
MDAEHLLNDLCARHGVDPSQGTRLLPLVRWALRGPEDARKRILAVVEKTLAEGAEGSESLGKFNDAADHAILTAVAKILHNWTPDSRILDLGGGGGPEEQSDRESA